MKKIPLTKGMEALVDDEDFEYLNSFKWHFVKIRGHGGGYAVRAHYYASRKKITVPMHQQIMNYSYNQECDHIDGNGINNQKSNLRVCTHAENLRNQHVSRSNKFGVTGVCKHSNKKFFMARIVVDGKNIHLGNHRTFEAAKKARLEGEIKYFGEFRRKTEDKIS